MNNTYDAPYDLGTVIVTKATKYQIFDFPNVKLSSGINFLHPDNDFEDLEAMVEDGFEIQLGFKAGDSVGILLSGDDYSWKELDPKEIDHQMKLYGIIDFKIDGVLHHNGYPDHCGELCNFVVYLDDDNYFFQSGEYTITTRENQKLNELDNINSILGTNFTAIIMSFS